MLTERDLTAATKAIHDVNDKFKMTMSDEETKAVAIAVIDAVDRSRDGIVVAHDVLHNLLRP